MMVIIRLKGGIFHFYYFESYFNLYQENIAGKVIKVIIQSFSLVFYYTKKKKN